MNIIASINENSKEFLYLKQIYTQLKSEFPQVSIYKVENDEGFDDKKYQNYVICGYKSNNNRNIKEKLLYLEVKNIKETSEIYTDIYSPIEKFL